MDDAVVIGQHDDRSGLWHVFEGQGHLLTCGSTGSGKGQCHVIPNLWKYPGSVFVVDVKGDNYAASKEERGVLHKDRVFRFDVSNPRESATYNPLDFVSRDEWDIWDECRALADMIVVPDTDKYFEGKARDLISAVIQYVLLCDVLDSNMSTVCKVIWSDLEQFAEHLIGMEALGNPELEEAANGLRSIAEKEFSGIINSARRSLEIWRSPRIRALTQQTSIGWQPEALKTPGASIFVIIPPGQVELYASVMRVMIGQHINQLMRQHSTKPDYPIMFMLDEFPLLGYLRPIETLLDVGRSYGLRGWLFIQNYGQLERAWPNPDGVLSACALQCFMDVNDPKTERHILDRMPSSKGLLRNEERPLLTQGELTGPQWKDRILVIPKMEGPIRLRRVYAYALKPEKF